MRQVLDGALALIPGSDGAAIELHSGRNQLTYAATARELSVAVGVTVDMSGSLSGLAVTTGAVQHFVDAALDQRVGTVLGARLGISSMLSVSRSCRPVVASAS